MSLSLNLAQVIRGSYSIPAGLGTSLYEPNKNQTKTLSDGTLADQADLYYESPVGGRSIPDSPGFEDLDLNNLLIDAVGRALPLLKVKVFFLYAYPDNASDLILGGAAANAWVGWWGAATHTQKFHPDGSVLKIEPGLAGWSVITGTGDILRVAKASAGNGRYDLIIAGTSA